MITKKTEYAITALWKLASNTRNLTISKEIAQRQAIPPKYLPRIIVTLSQAGLLTSTRGYGGSLKLKQPAEEITLLSVIEAMQGKPQLFQCQSGHADCVNHPDCRLRSIYNQAQDALENVFNTTRL
ncbi:MAG: Rrf2 family transcriptional regulator [candidate division Zixibacteria bacterium]|nr:Rrf2 family transcriptional regulator [candidate division Zixibacteria bacterium]MDD5427131.1 Rrf2 family transcriptional regulator [candidate division Zixibacteria bacterium]